MFGKYCDIYINEASRDTYILVFVGYDAEVRSKRGEYTSWKVNELC